MNLLHKRTILIVEDNPMNRVIYQIALGKTGAKLIFDTVGRDVIYKLKKLEKLDLIILDLMLPSGKTGFEIYQEIRAVSAFNNVPVIAISAAEAGDAMRQAQYLGFAGFIAKPVAYELLPQQVLQIMDGGEIWLRRA